MVKSTQLILVAAYIALWAPATEAGSAAEGAVRGFHTLMPGYWGGDGRPHIAECERFIREVLASRGVNVLVLEVGYNFQYKSCPKIGNLKAVGPDEVKRLVAVCRETGTRLIPELNCLGHQATGPGSLLGEYPDFQEKPGQYPKFLKEPMPEQTRGASYCPLRPEVHKFVFTLLDELAETFDADTVHVGMDEVFAIASSQCPRCAEKDPAVLFAGEVNAIHEHLVSTKRAMWMWGDRFLLARELGVVDWGWATSRNYTHPAVDKVPTGIVVCDWQYERTPATPQFFIRKGFRVVSCPWWMEDVALKQLKMMRDLAADQDKKAAAKSLGIMQTTWVEMQDFITAWNDKIPPLEKQPEWQRKGDFPWKAAKRSASVFKSLSECWRLSDEELSKRLAEKEKEKPRTGAAGELVVWDGDGVAGGVGWAGPQSEAITIRPQEAETHNGKVALEFRGEGKGWIGCLWNWHGWWPEGIGTDITPYTHLSFWIKVTGDAKPESLEAGLTCSTAKKTGALSVTKYCADALDGKWHEVLIPLKDFYDKEKTEFDQQKAQQLYLNTWSQTASKFSIFVDEIGFDSRAAAKP